MPDYPAERRRALELLARSDEGCTAALLTIHGLASGVIAGLVDTGLVTMTTERVPAGRRTVIVTRLKITDGGRKAPEL